ncbi:hypothetical protein ElyMa_006795700 [Elysia marginata]|uniref:Uncharacterized protein n=1 Tax=Elysia marginata TaxID=1093978 RepID=A0AAV4J1Z5_9GAST|nr:hypothetical protein ElyMa_006795700 [Elysia marginata]
MLGYYFYTDKNTRWLYHGSNDFDNDEEEANGGVVVGFDDDFDNYNGVGIDENCDDNNDDIVNEDDEENNVVFVNFDDDVDTYNGEDVDEKCDNDNDDDDDVN